MEMSRQAVTKHLTILEEAHLVVANGKLVTEDHKLDATDDVRVIRVISGG